MKTCSKCKQSKPVSEFNKNAKRRDGLQTQCRICTKEYYSEYYKGEKEQARLRKHNTKVREEIKTYIRKAKSAPCLDCDGLYPYFVMDFDHREPSVKVMGVAQLVNYGSLDRVKEEIAKCDLVCANCHRIRTHSG